MDLSDIPLFSMLRNRMGYLSQRQQVIATNVANADTPAFKPGELQPFSFQVQATLGPTVQAVTQPGHMQAAGARGGSPGRVKAIKTHDSETTLDGNSVVLEEEMMKLTDSRMNYDAAITFYQQSLNMLRLATRTPGKGA